jgi:hypothetical protein
MGTVSTVTIGTDTFSVYALTADPVADATSFWNGRLGAEATAWGVATSDNRKRALNAASDWIDRAVGSLFSGTKTSDAQPREFPRDGASYCGTAVPDGTTPDALAFATFWLAGALLVNPTLASGSGTGSNVKQAQAGSASVTFFSPTLGSATDTRLPVTAMDYLKCLFSGAGVSLAAGMASGVDRSSAFGPCDFQRSDGFA